jgi:YjbE family integral membrane protein
VIVDPNAPGFDAAPGQAAFWVAAFRIVVINVLLSGDNAVVIALACRNLPRRQRLWGMVIGSGVAVVLLIVFAGLVARLMELPYLKAAGGIALFYIAAKLLLPEAHDETEVQAEAHLWRAVLIVVVADIIMSLDNIIAVATAAQGNWTLLAIGLAVSIPIIIAGAALIMALLDRLPILVWLGAALLGWVAAEAVVTDKAVAPALAAAFGEDVAMNLATNLAMNLQRAAGAAGAVLVLVVGGLWRRALAKKHAKASG